MISCLRVTARVNRTAGAGTIDSNALERIEQREGMGRVDLNPDGELRDAVYRADGVHQAGA